MSPIYDYKCPQCQVYFRDIQVKDLEEKQICPECGIECERQFPTNTNAHYRTNGFYKTDYKDFAK